MTLTKKIILALGLATAAGASYAQTTSTSDSPVGVLGHDYTELSVGTQDIEHYSPNSYDVSIGGNRPVSPNFDVGAGYSYGWIRGSAPGHSNTLSTTAKLYTALNGVKPFVGLGLGYQWTHFTGFRDNQGLWGAAAGVEIPAGPVSITPRVVYADDFEGSSRSTQQTSYEVEGNYWYSRTASLFGAVGKTDVRKSSFDSWDYRIGARLKF